MKTHSAFRLVEVYQGRPLTLFHGIKVPGADRRTRKIPIGEWIQAEQRPVRDGTGPFYTSGFNVLLTQDRMSDYAKRFKAPRILMVIPVKVRGLRRKEHSKSDVWLADWMRVDEDWISHAKYLRELA